jgi:hypothetical protein
MAAGIWPISRSLHGRLMADTRKRDGIWYCQLAIKLSNESRSGIEVSD